MKSVWFLFNCQLASPPWVSDWREGLPVPQSGSCFIFPCLVPSLTCYRSIAMYRPSPFAGQQHPLSYQSGHLFFLLECDRSHFVVQTGVELKLKAIPLPQSSECWGYKWEPPPLTWAPYFCWGEACNERERERGPLTPGSFRMSQPQRWSSKDIVSLYHLWQRLKIKRLLAPKYWEFKGDIPSTGKLWQYIW